MPRNFLLSALLVAGLGLAGAWAFTSTMRLWFLESGYPVIVAKQEMLDTCSVGDLAVIGDSRVEAAVIPALMPQMAGNLGIGSMTPVETYFIARKLLACPKPPRFVVYSHSIEAFQQVNQGLWQRAAKFGLLGYGDLRAVQHQAELLGDETLKTASTGDGLTGWARDLAYTSGFPSIFTSSVVEARGIGRLASNQERLRVTRQRRGHVVYPHGQTGLTVGREAAVQRFAPSATEVWYFNQTLQILSDAGVRTLVVAIPAAAATVHAAAPAVLADYAAFLSRHAPAVAPMEAWPDELFVDGAHMDLAGAEAYSRRLAACVAGWTETGGLESCDFRWAVGPSITAGSGQP